MLAVQEPQVDSRPTLDELFAKAGVKRRLKDDL
jgi:hypothetical protein